VYLIDVCTRRTTGQTNADSDLIFFTISSKSYISTLIDFLFHDFLCMMTFLNNIERCAVSLRQLSFFLLVFSLLSYTHFLTVSN